MRIVGQYWLASSSEFAGDCPIVASYGGIAGCKLDPSVATHEPIKQAREKIGIIHSFGGIELDRRIEIENLLRFFRSQLRQKLRIFQFRTCVSRHRVGRHARKTVLWLPWLWFEAGKLKANRQSSGAG